MAATARTQIGGQGHNSPKVFTAVANPTVNNDGVNDGIGIGDIWVNTLTPAVLVCTSNATGAANWLAGAATFPGTAITALTNNTGGTPATTLAVVTAPAAITDNTGGTPSATLAAITAPAANATTSLTADMTAVKNAIAQFKVSQTADAAAIASLTNSVAQLAVTLNALLAACKTAGIAS